MRDLPVAPLLTHDSISKISAVIGVTRRAYSDFHYLGRSWPGEYDHRR